MIEKNARSTAKPQYDLTRKSFLGVACVCLAVMPFFGINNFLHSRYLMGVGTFAIIIIFAFNAWSILQRDRYYHSLTLFGLVPAVITFLTLSLLTQGMIGVFWCYPAAIVFYFTLYKAKNKS